MLEAFGPRQGHGKSHDLELSHGGRQRPASNMIFLGGLPAVGFAIKFPSQLGFL